MKEDRDKERKRANELTEKLRKVEKEKQKVCERRSDE